MNLGTKLLLWGSLFFLFGCSQTKELRVSTQYTFASLGGDEYWKKPFKLESPAEDRYSGGDTLYYTSARGTGKAPVTKYIRIETNAYANEPSELQGHRLLGVFQEPTGQPGTSILVYVKKGQGVLRKFFHAPGQLFFMAYDSVNGQNPFKEEAYTQFDLPW